MPLILSTDFTPARALTPAEQDANAQFLLSQANTQSDRALASAVSAGTSAGQAMAAAPVAAATAASLAVSNSVSAISQAVNPLLANRRVFVAPYGYTGAVPPDYTLVTQDVTNTATVTMVPGQNIIAVKVGGVGTLVLVAITAAFSMKFSDVDGGLAKVNRVYQGPA